MTLLCTGCPSAHLVKRNFEEAAKTDIQAWQTQRIAETQNVGAQKAAKVKRVKRTPVLTTTGQVAILPNGQPAFSVEVEDESTDESTSTTRDVLAQSNGGMTDRSKRSKSQSEEEETRRHGIKLMILAAAMAAGFALLIWQAVKRGWILGWIFK
jgi:hypothetical protein